jgi:hypothetical protein
MLSFDYHLPFRFEKDRGFVAETQGRWPPIVAVVAFALGGVDWYPQRVGDYTAGNRVANYLEPHALGAGAAYQRQE